MKPMKHEDGDNPEQHDKKLRQADRRTQSPVKAGHQIGESDIEKPCRRHGQHIGRRDRKPVQGKKTRKSPGEHRGTRQQIPGEGPFPGKAALQENAEVTHLLRNLMGHDRQTRRDANRDGDEKSCGDRDAVHEVVQSIPDQDQDTS
jgi:hypothetical protein